MPTPQASVSFLHNSHFGEDVPHNLPVLILCDVRELGDREEKEVRKGPLVRAGGGRHLVPLPACHCAHDRNGTGGEFSDSSRPPGPVTWFPSAHPTAAAP